MKVFKWIIGGVFTVTLIITILITAVEIAVYADMSFYEKEYQEYNVEQDVNMHMEDIMIVTDEMMQYLRGNRDDLLIQVPIDGTIDYFFNEKEIAHMEDVRDLFIGGIYLRWICLAILLVSVLLLIIGKVNWSFVLARSIEIGLVLFSVITLLLAAVVSINFTKAFTKFHEIFFSNDLWLLDPNTDRLINILPEGFFVDTAIRIGIIFTIMILIILLLAIICEHVIINRKKTS